MKNSDRLKNMRTAEPVQLRDEQHPPDPLGPGSSWVWVEYLCGDKGWMGCLEGRQEETKAFVLKLLCDRHQIKNTPVELVITRKK